MSVGRAKALLDTLHAELSQLRTAVTPAFEAMKLYRLGKAEIGRATFTYEVEVLQGSHPDFLPDSLELEDRVPPRALVLSSGEGRCIPLLPLIRMAAPQGADNACYFYNRTENGTARFVSYHQGDHAEDLSPEPLEFLQRWQQDSDSDTNGES